MRTFFVMLVTAAAVSASGCGATARTATVQTSAFPTLTAATATFISKDHGKDADAPTTSGAMFGSITTSQNGF